MYIAGVSRVIIRAINLSSRVNVIFTDFIKQNQKEVSYFQQKQAKKAKKVLAL